MSEISDAIFQVAKYEDLLSLQFCRSTAAHDTLPMARPAPSHRSGLYAHGMLGRLLKLSSGVAPREESPARLFEDNASNKETSLL
jgi:hypothetical protein